MKFFLKSGNSYSIIVKKAVLTHIGKFGHFAWNTQSQRVIEKCGFAYLKTVEHKTRYETVERTKIYILRAESGEK